LRQSTGFLRWWKDKESLRNIDAAISSYLSMRYLTSLNSVCLMVASAFGPVVASNAMPQDANPPSLEENAGLAKAKELLEQSKVDEAEAMARKFIAQHPRQSDGYFLLGLTLFRRVQAMARSAGTFVAPGEVPSTALDPQKRGAIIRESLEAFTEGAKYGKPSADDLKTVSFDFILIGDFASADKWLTVALDWNPTDADTWYYLGRAKYNENRFEEAVQAFQRCLALRPRDSLAADGVGLSYEGLNRMADAITWLQTAISWQEASQQKTAEPYVDLGDLFTQQARFDDALPVLQNAIAIDPRNIRAHEKLGKVYLNLDRLAEAQSEFEKTISLDPEQPAPHYLMAQTYRKQGQLDKARLEMNRFQLLKAKESPAKSGMQ